MSHPLILLAYANQEGVQYLPYLEQEVEQVRQSLIPLVSKAKIDFAPVFEELNPLNFFNIFTELRQRVEIIHFGGHADETQIDLKQGSYKIRQFVELLQGEHQLKLVFLNGCSTEGLVDALLQTGVQAVIATNRKIPDRDASTFAKHFYFTFSRNGTSLATAFSQATSSMPKWEDSKEPSYRDRTPTDKDTKQNEIPWGLYLKEENKAILDWSISFDAHIQENPQNNTLRTEKWEELYANYQETQGRKLHSEENIERLGNLFLFHTDRGEIQKAEEMKKEQTEMKNDLEQLNEEKNKLLKEISELSNVTIVKTQRDKLTYALNNINFSKEIDKCREYIYPESSTSALKIGGFIIRGSRKCGLQLLKERVITTAGLCKTEKKVFIFDFQAKGRPLIPSKTGIWVNILYQLEDKSNSQINQDKYRKAIKDNEGSIDKYNELKTKVGKKIFENHLQLRDVILIFKNAHKNTLSQNKEIIEGFWYTLLSQIESYQKNSTRPLINKLYLIFLDDGCHLGALEGGLDILKDYDTVLNKEKLKKNFTYLLPISEKILLEDLIGWERVSNIPLKIPFDKFVKKTGDFVLPTIKSICDHTDNLIKYEDYFPKYEEQINTGSNTSSKIEALIKTI